MEFFKVEGSQSAIYTEIAKFGLDIESSRILFDYVEKNQWLLGDNESIALSLKFPSFPSGTVGFMMPNYSYYVNLRIATVVIAALLLDINLTKGAAATFLALKGFSSTAITQLSEIEGEKCIVKETLRTKDRIGQIDILLPFHGECCNNDLECKYRRGEKCCCSEHDIFEIYSRLSERNMFTKWGTQFKYNW